MIKDSYIKEIIENSKNYDDNKIDGIFEKARNLERLTVEEIGILLELEDEKHIKEMIHQR